MRWHPLAEKLQRRQPMGKTTAPQEAAGSGLPSRALLALAESKGDAKETVYSAELLLLRRVAETSSDLVKARSWDEFREAMGGMKPLDHAHGEAVAAYEQWLSDGDDSQ